MKPLYEMNFRVAELEQNIFSKISSDSIKNKTSFSYKIKLDFKKVG